MAFSSEENRRKILVLGSSGNIGAFVVDALANQDAGVFEIVAAVRDEESDRASKLRLLSQVTVVSIDMLNEESFYPAVIGTSSIFFCMPQEFNPSQMVQAHSVLASVMSQNNISYVVKISSFGVDKKSKVFLPSTPQGPLGNAHAEGEQLLLSEYHGSDQLKLVSLRPTSFSTNFMNYDVPSIKAEKSFSSPLGLGTLSKTSIEAGVVAPDATAQLAPRVNWVHVRDIGRAAAVLLIHEALVDTLVETPEPVETDACSSVIAPAEASGDAPAVKVSRQHIVVDIPGPSSNTVSALECAELASVIEGQQVTYIPTELPAIEPYRQLWVFLRAGGFDYSNHTLESILAAGGFAAPVTIQDIVLEGLTA